MIAMMKARDHPKAATCGLGAVPSTAPNPEAFASTRDHTTPTAMADERALVWPFSYLILG